MLLSLRPCSWPLALAFLLASEPLLPATAAAQAPADSATAVVTAFHQALASGDSLKVVSLLAPDAVILESGELETLREYRSHHLPADIAFARAVPSSRVTSRVSVAGGVAWVIATSSATGTYGDRPINSQNAELVVLSRESTGWRIRAIHWSSMNRRKGS
jgi:ketosteroid isomerase-like protein